MLLTQLRDGVKAADAMPTSLTHALERPAKPFAGRVQHLRKEVALAKSAPAEPVKPEETSITAQYAEMCGAAAGPETGAISTGTLIKHPVCFGRQ